jgi:primosomal protein N'
MATRVGLRPGTRVVVPWGLDEPRGAVVIDVWGDPPTQIRVELDQISDDEEPTVLLLSPSVVSPAG